MDNKLPTPPVTSARQVHVPDQEKDVKEEENGSSGGGRKKKGRKTGRKAEREKYRVIDPQPSQCFVERRSREQLMKEMKEDSTRPKIAF